MGICLIILTTSEVEGGKRLQPKIIAIDSHLIQLRTVALQLELIYKGPSEDDQLAVDVEFY